MLPDCRADGTYGYFGFSPKEEMVRLEDKDDVSANLPISAGVINAKIGGSFKQGTSLDIGMMLIGKQRTTRAAIARADLIEDRPGACEGATHFVRGATLGAFVMATGSKNEAATTVSLFGLPGGKIGTGAASSSDKEARHADGQLDACKTATPKDTDPPGQCQALLRLELTLIDETGSAKPAHESPEPPDPCGPGHVLSKGKCTEPTASDVHLCKPNDVKDCDEQCAKGDMGSCSRMGYYHQEGTHGVDKDLAKAVELYDKACTGGWAIGCGSLAGLYMEGRGVKKDPDKAQKLLTQSCDQGWPFGCSFLGIVLWMGNGVTKDRNAAVPFLRRGCNGGSVEGCFLLGEASRKGEGGETKAPDKARKLYKMGCDGGDPMACYAVGVAMQDGIGGPKDMKGSQVPFQKACKAGLKEACKELK
jgi:hypothetical protein